MKFSKNKDKEAKYSSVNFQSNNTLTQNKSTKLINNAHTRSNKSIEKYISNKFKALEVEDNKKINENSQYINTSNSIYLNTVSNLQNKNKILSSYKKVNCQTESFLDDYCINNSSNSTFLNKSSSNNNLYKNSYNSYNNNIISKIQSKIEKIEINEINNKLNQNKNTTQPNSYLTTINNCKESFNKSEHNISENNFTNSTEIANLHFNLRNSGTPISQNNSDIRKSLIQIVNDTKDKAAILKELDYIYLNILQVSNPNNNYREDEMFKNNMTISMSNLMLNCDNSPEPNLLQNEQTTSKPSILQREKSTTNTDEISLNSNLLLENELLRRENSKLQMKLEEIDKKFEKILTENENLKGYVMKRTDNIKHMEDNFKKIQNELNDVKKKQIMNNYYIKSNLPKSVPKQINQMNKSQFIPKVNGVNTSNTGSTNNFSTLNSKLSKKINTKSLKKIDTTNMNNLKNSRILLQTNLDESYTSMSILSIDKLKPEDKNIYYYPRKYTTTNLNTENNTKINTLIPRIEMKKLEEDILSDSSYYGSKEPLGLGFKEMAMSIENAYEDDDAIYNLSVDE